jgi:hypothetical protein
MKPKPLHHVLLSTPTYHALCLVARVDDVAPSHVVECAVVSYLRARLDAMDKARRPRNDDALALRDRTSVTNLQAWRATHSDRR